VDCLVVEQISKYIHYSSDPYLKLFQIKYHGLFVINRGLWANCVSVLIDRISTIDYSLIEGSVYPSKSLRSAPDAALRLLM
jgi:hypothetical protein